MAVRCKYDRGVVNKDECIRKTVYIVNPTQELLGFGANGEGTKSKSVVDSPANLFGENPGAQLELIERDPSLLHGVPIGRGDDLNPIGAV